MTGSQMLTSYSLDPLAVACLCACPMFWVTLLLARDPPNLFHLHVADGNLLLSFFLSHGAWAQTIKLLPYASGSIPRVDPPAPTNPAGPVHSEPAGPPHGEGRLWTCG